jgi:hypothetical protein
MQIIGMGRVGGALVRRGTERGVECTGISRDQGWESLEAPAGTPVIVSTRNDDLDRVLDRVPVHRHKDLVFVQNGMLRDWLAGRGLEGATRGLLFFAVASRGATPVPGGDSPFCGPHAETVARWLQALDLPSSAVTPSAFAEVELEKLLWNCVFGLLCEVHDATVGEVVERHRADVDRLAQELARVAMPSLGVTVEVAPVVERMCAYSLSIRDYRGAVKEWGWRNGWFVQAGLAQGMATPVHATLLERAGR